MDQKENIQNEKVSKEAAGLPGKSPAEQTADMSRPRRTQKSPVGRVVEARSQDNVNIARTARQWIRWELEIHFI